LSKSTSNISEQSLQTYQQIPLICHDKAFLINEGSHLVLSRIHPITKKFKKEQITPKEFVLAYLKPKPKDLKDKELISENPRKSSKDLRKEDEVTQLDDLEAFALLVKVKKFSVEYFNDPIVEIETVHRVKIDHIELDPDDHSYQKKVVYSNVSVYKAPIENLDAIKAIFHVIADKIKQSKHADRLKNVSINEMPNDFEDWANQLILELKLVDEDKFQWLMIDDLQAKYEKLMEYLGSVFPEWDLEEEMSEKLKQSFVIKKQRDVLMLRMRSIRKALAHNHREFLKSRETEINAEEIDEDEKKAEENPEEDSATDIVKRIKALPMKDETRVEVDRILRQQSAGMMTSHEAHQYRNLLEWIVALPWEKRAESVPLQIPLLKSHLDKEHSGLEDVKQRMLEYMATRELSQKNQGTFICLSGPPGVGKTTLARAIASALNKPFVRISLGGVHDESDIRGHRRTYVASLPGRIVYALKQAKVKDPVILLDEIDKMSEDVRGKPEAALLEVLDPEQNHEFRDHYIEVPIDLSEILFICTANQIANLSPPLKDRLEIIELSGYQQKEKLAIAQKYLVPKQLKLTGLAEDQLSFSPSALNEIIEKYTKEAGVRQLDREIAKVCRKLALETIKRREEEITEPLVWTIHPSDLISKIGAPKYDKDQALQIDKPGIVNGLAWTSFGGDVLSIECIRTKGKGNLLLTGQLGNVMQESAKAAFSALRADAARWEIPDEMFSESDFHIHLPEGATPKDGPSAGITLYTALCSLLTKRLFRSDCAMSGECTISGRVLAVGGLKEKILAAQRLNLRLMVLPKANQEYVCSLEPDVIQGIEFHWVKDVYDAAKIALHETPIH
jgi:ATP-dependent Lon protease